MIVLSVDLDDLVVERDDGGAAGVGHAHARPASAGGVAHLVEPVAAQLDHRPPVARRREYRL